MRAIQCSTGVGLEVPQRVAGLAWQIGHGVDVGGPHVRGEQSIATKGTDLLNGLQNQVRVMQSERKAGC